MNWGKAVHSHPCPGNQAPNEEEPVRQGILPRLARGDEPGVTEIAHRMRSL